jgi:hypothetical protein
VIGPTPLLDCFRRGDIPRDARLLAAKGALSPRAYEQLAILVFLSEDRDPDIRAAAAQTIDRIPIGALQDFLARSDVPLGLREFFADRGIFPAEIPPIVDDFDRDDALIEEEPGEESRTDDRETAVEKLAKMGFSERLKAAFKGSREMRAILIRDPNRAVAAAVLSSPKVSEQELESFARMSSVSEDVLRIIGSNRAWLKNYGVVVALTRNPKTPLAMSLTLMSRLNDRDLSKLSIDRNVPDPLRFAARRRIISGDR